MNLGLVTGDPYAIYPFCQMRLDQSVYFFNSKLYKIPKTGQKSQKCITIIELVRLASLVSSLKD